ncbi:DUF4332 domain-containing protein [Verrucomicrobiaceae bacterium 5K15]|uniref:DUF4332 domain-containing protein n=1 Tax=Oceaniferula flava TaxID=2800421 RepID=A0AAE2SAF9_9BACT|nr:hypothetical protein [Oceaniferula flavus]MBK1854476.1 DUF4332 domain-containing protein [Oceaniferula flavus]MBM1135782.1 DUF4332 domain-containing protein [Oceaniferula flavus]
MPKIEDIPALPSDAAELLEAVGYLDVADLAGADLHQLHAELVKANEKLQIAETTPSVADLKSWRGELGDEAAAEENFADDDADEAETSESEASEAAPKPSDHQGDLHVIEMEEGVTNFENEQEVIDMLQMSPTAEPLPAALIKENRLAVSDIPEGILLTAWEGELEVNVMNASKPTEAEKREADAKRTGLMTSRIRGFDQADAPDHVVKPLDRGKPKDVVSVSKDLNSGIDPSSRRFVRGVLHPSPGNVKTSAFFTAVVQILLVANLIGIPWMLIHEYRSGVEMMGWVIGLFSGLVVAALCYLFWGLSARCRICSQRQFTPKKCLKNKKAHHIPLIGYIFPTALHALFYKWFYCIYCGTAIRLKK